MKHVKRKILLIQKDVLCHFLSNCITFFNISCYKYKLASWIELFDLPINLKSDEIVL